MSLSKYCNKPDTTNVLIIGHSYVRDVKRSAIFPADYNAEYLFKPGATFETFLNSYHNVEDFIDFEPAFVVVVLGGNDLSCYSVSKVKSNSIKFFTFLKNTFSSARLLVTQIEPQFYHLNNRFTSPENYRNKSNIINRFWARQTHNHTFNLITVQGPLALTQRDLYRSDGVHLNEHGLTLLVTRMVTVIAKFAV